MKEKLFYFYLLSNRFTNPAGVYPCTKKDLRADFGISREEVEEMLVVFEKAGKAFHFNGYIIIPKWLKHQKLLERKTLYFAARAVLISLPKNIKEFIVEHKEFFDFEGYKELQSDVEEIVDAGVITTLEMSQRLGVSRAYALRRANEIFEGKIERGVPALWAECEVELLRQYLNEVRGEGQNDADGGESPSVEGGQFKVKENQFKVKGDQFKVKAPSTDSVEGEFKVKENQFKVKENQFKVKGDSDSEYIYNFVDSSSREACGKPVENSTKQQQQNFSKIKAEAKAAGFFLTDGQAACFSALDSLWLSGKYSFFVFAAQKISADPKYSAKPRQERERIFAGAWKYQNWLQEYPDWLAARLKSEKQKSLERLKTSPPGNCLNCGAGLAGQKCPECGGFVIFDESRGIWEYQPPPEFSGFRQKIKQNARPPPKPSEVEF
jgi:hypothetical protein